MEHHLILLHIVSCSNPNTNCEFNNCSTPSLTGEDLQPTHQYCTNYTFQLKGHRNKTYSKVVNLVIATGALISYQVTVNVNKCPFGFRNWNDTLSICSAEDVLVKYYIASDVDSLTVLRNNTMWIGNSSSNTTLAVHLNCPYDYCNTSSITFRIIDEQDNQCNYNRVMWRMNVRSILF